MERVLFLGPSILILWKEAYWKSTSQLSCFCLTWFDFQIEIRWFAELISLNIWSSGLSWGQCPGYIFNQREVAAVDIHNEAIPSIYIWLILLGRVKVQSLNMWSLSLAILVWSLSQLIKWGLFTTNILVLYQQNIRARVGTEGNCLNLIKDIFIKPTTSNILIGEKLDAKTRNGNKRNREWEERYKIVIVSRRHDCVCITFFFKSCFPLYHQWTFRTWNKKKHTHTQ